MNTIRSLLVAGLTGMIVIPSAFAQSTPPADEVPPPPQFEEAASSQDQQSGLSVEERRFENRLDGVTVEHSGGLKEYYNLNDPDLERRDGGITEGNAMRTWRLGGSKKKK